MALWETLLSLHGFCVCVCSCICLSWSILLLLWLSRPWSRRGWVSHHCFFQKKTLAPPRLRKTPHPPKPPHVPFSCLCLLHSHDPLTKASSPVEYHMFPVKPNFFFSSFKTSICQAKSIEKASLLPFFLSPSHQHVSEYFKSLRFCINLQPQQKSSAF